MYVCNDNANKSWAEMCKSIEQVNYQYISLLNSEICRLGRNELVNRNKSAVQRMKGTIKGLTRKKGVGLNNMIESDEPYINYEDTAYFSNERIAVYTCVIGAYDTPQKPLLYPDNIDYYFVTDRDIEVDGWKVINVFGKMPKEATTNTLGARYYKTHPHILFPEYSYSVYVDGNMRIVSDLTALITNIGSDGIAIHCHKNRACSYDEINACLDKGKGSKEELLRFEAFIENEGMPRRYGLLETGVIARKHDEQKCIDIMEEWWKMQCSFVPRDQLSLPYILWKRGIAINDIATLGNNIALNPRIQIGGHC